MAEIGAARSSAPLGRAEVVLDFTRSELFDRTFNEGMALVEETAAYLDGEGRRDSKLLSRAAALSYAAESMKLTTRLMQIASWLLVQRAVREGEMDPMAACEPRYRLKAREEQPGTLDAELPVALVELVLQTERLHERVLYLDRRMYLDDTPAPEANPVQSQLDRLKAAFGG
ncbi:DUF1465 family protein [Brevundimonas sp. 2R-24]|uniref:DUF1465 family protein n=2 Tax=Peiella sedimenti TaxID=3061083 RepID=A0ABT8SJR7_9CAUL|nr:DUF1465 family protein [Caulobacteraceae bacterium XZ-24]